MDTKKRRIAWWIAGVVAVVALMLLTLAAVQSQNKQDSRTGTPTTSVKKEYAQVGDLKMYYEVHGEGGRPLVLLHGGMTTIELSFASILPELAKDRQVIAVEQQGHGRTADIDRPLSYAQMADDTAALLKSINVKDADVFGYSDGGIVGLRLAAQYPDLVHKLAIAGSYTKNEGVTAESLQAMQMLSADYLPESMSEPYKSVAPNPENWPVLVEKVKQLGLGFKGWSDNEIRSIEDPVLVMLGDKDIVTPEHGVEMFRMIPKAQLYIAPNTTHYPGLFADPDQLTDSLTTFYTTDPQPAAGH